jgi:Mce-associated membrane protein
VTDPQDRPSEAPGAEPPVASDRADDELAEDAGTVAVQTTDDDAVDPSGDAAADEGADKGADEGASTATEAATAQPAGDRPSGARRFLRSAGVAWLVAGVAVLALVLLAIFAVPAMRAESERAEIRDRAEVIAARVTTFEGATIEEWVSETRALATGAYARQLDDVFDQELRDALRENEVESVGTIQRSFVQAIDGDRAEVFVLARQSSVNAQRAQPVEDELRIEIELRREDGEWLASDIAVLGPQQPTGAVPPPPADGDE